MLRLSSFLSSLTLERLGWFGAGLSAAGAGLLGYQLVLASASGGPPPVVLLSPTRASVAAARTSPSATPRPSATAWPTDTPRPTPTPRPTATPRPTSTPWPTSTARPTATPRPPLAPTPLLPDPLATAIGADAEGLVGAVATFAARTSDVLQSLPLTPSPR